MSLKKLSVPILPHLVKFLDKEYDKRASSYIIRGKIIPPRYYNTRDIQNYFNDPSDRYVFIQVTTNDSRLYKLYAWIQHVDHHFSSKMIDFVAARYRIQHVSVSIREFLKLYSITESEYAFDTAYKKWQRSVIYKKLRSDKRRIDYAGNQ